MNNTIETAFVGRVGRDPELRRVKGGELALLTLSVAVADDSDDASSPECVRAAVLGERASCRLERWEGRDGTPAPVWP